MRQYVIHDRVSQMERKKDFSGRGDWVSFAVKACDPWVVIQVEEEAEWEVQSMSLQIPMDVNSLLVDSWGATKSL